MALPHAAPRFDLESYLAWEAEQPEKHEYHQGEVFAMVGARLPHQAVWGSIFAALRERLRGGPCRVFPDGTKLRLDADDAVLYPDVMVTCDPRDRGAEDRFLSWPCLVVEVLSDSTAAYDLGPKFALYRRLATLREYLVVDPGARRVEVFRRDDEGRWVLYDFTAAAECTLTSVGAVLPLATIFEDIDAPDQPPPSPPTGSTAES
jgi:Uma2 family endonuclease